MYNKENRIVKIFIKYFINTLCFPVVDEFILINKDY